jgi:hypothetical protein
VDLTNKDGEVGSARVWAISLLCVVSLAIVALGSTVVFQPISTGDAAVKGTCNVTSDDAGTATLTVDAVAAALTGNVTGNLTGNVTGDVTGSVIDTGTALNVTNGQAVSLSGGVILLNGIGGADDSTNTVTVSGTVGTMTTLIVAAASSNLITIADSGTVYLSSAWLGDNNDCITLYVRTATTNVVEVSSIDN